MARRYPILSLAAILGAMGLLFLAQGMWIPAKAAVAQVLLRQAWADTLAGEGKARPWPWADTWPVARLVVPEHGVNLVILAGANGGSLAFAPAHMDGTAIPGSLGTSLVAGHRDTHFEFLRRLRLEDRLVIETPAGESLAYEVINLSIVDTRAPLATHTHPTGRSLVLVTCYPFETLVPGGPLRYVVTAAEVGAEE